ncbi:membrane hypothetical protein [Vibrio chagasii]|nr:membrane hypothetical protein [Vibrio chagasii]
MPIKNLRLTSGYVLICVSYPVFLIAVLLLGIDEGSTVGASALSLMHILAMFIIWLSRIKSKSDVITSHSKYQCWSFMLYIATGTIALSFLMDKGIGIDLSTIYANVDEVPTEGEGSLIWFISSALGMIAITFWYWYRTLKGAYCYFYEKTLPHCHPILHTLSKQGTGLLKKFKVQKQKRH